MPLWLSHESKKVKGKNKTTTIPLTAEFNDEKVDVYNIDGNGYIIGVASHGNFSYEFHRTMLMFDGPDRPVYMGNVRLPKCNRFSLLYRFYVFSTSTCADHLFYFRSVLPDAGAESLYPTRKMV